MNSGSKHAGDKEWIVEYIETLWSDIHYSREQSWRILEVPLITILGLLTFNIVSKNEVVLISTSVMIIALSVSGLLISLRHSKLITAKLRAIKCLEKRLKLEEVTRIIEESQFKIPVRLLISSLYALFLSVSLLLLINIVTNSTLWAAIAAGITYLVVIIAVQRTLSKWNKMFNKLYEEQCNGNQGE